MSKKIEWRRRGASHASAPGKARRGHFGSCFAEEGASGTKAREACRREGREDGATNQQQQPLLPETAAPRPATFKLADSDFPFG